MTSPTKAKMQNFQIEIGEDKDGQMLYRTIAATSASSALSMFLKRGTSGLGSGWALTRQPNGWIVAANKSQKQLERKRVRLREESYTRYSDKRVN